MDIYRIFGPGTACTNGFRGNDLLKFAELRAQLYTKIWMRPKQIEHGPFAHRLCAPPDGRHRGGVTLAEGQGVRPSRDLFKPRVGRTRLADLQLAVPRRGAWIGLLQGHLSDNRLHQGFSGQ